MNDDQIESLISAIKSISHGSISGPAGLEGLAMSIAGEGAIGHNSLRQAVLEVACSLTEISRSLDSVAEAIANHD